MGVRVDKYIGYVVDIKEEWNKLPIDQRDTWLFSDKKKTDIFVPYYSGWGNINLLNKVTIIDDGMNGHYTKLVYVLDYCEDTYGDDERLVDTINKHLGTIQVPHEIEEMLLSIYKGILGDKNINNFKVKLEHFIYWH